MNGMPVFVILGLRNGEVVHCEVREGIDFYDVEPRIRHLSRSFDFTKIDVYPRFIDVTQDCEVEP